VEDGNGLDCPMGGSSVRSRRLGGDGGDGFSSIKARFPGFACAASMLDVTFCLFAHGFLGHGSSAMRCKDITSARRASRFVLPTSPQPITVVMWNNAVQAVGESGLTSTSAHPYPSHSKIVNTDGYLKGSFY
jgi:hypothetical protein